MFGAQDKVAIYFPSALNMGISASLAQPTAPSLIFLVILAKHSVLFYTQIRHWRHCLYFSFCWNVLLCHGLGGAVIFVSFLHLDLCLVCAVNTSLMLKRSIVFYCYDVTIKHGLYLQVDRRGSSMLQLLTETTNYEVNRLLTTPSRLGQYFTLNFKVF